MNACVVRISTAFTVLKTQFLSSLSNYDVYQFSWYDNHLSNRFS